jgi:polyhydroxyalkanoate synthase subunit PhaC
MARARRQPVEPAKPVARTPAPEAASRALAVTPQPRAPVAVSPALPDDGDVLPHDAGMEALDRMLHASIAQLTGGLSPAALMAAYTDWAVHLAASPGKQGQLAGKAGRKALRFLDYMRRCAESAGKAEPCITPLPQDSRFSGEAWKQPPFNFLSQAFLLNQQWWHAATTGIAGVSKQNEWMVEFGARQILDMFSPSNFLLTNPELQKATFEQGGANLVRGFQNFLEDIGRNIDHKPPVGADAFRPGVNVAVTQGEVVYRNKLIELIQYAPQTEQVRPEPILITPAWIMKYYILDLSPHNSLVRYLVQRGFTVFMISWKNPGSDDRDLSMDDYRHFGIMAAIDAISRIMPDRKIHAAGYCIGGTLLSIAAAAMARDNDTRLKSVTLFAAQTDFTEAGELKLFINESQLDFLRDMMWEQGFLDTRQMAGAFHLLRSNDLVWSYALKNYLMGQREPMNDMMAWNADATRMPYRMHTEYLRRLFLDNELAEGRFEADGRPIALSDIHVPMFAVGTTKDHVAPWRSTYKIHLSSDTDVTYLLTTGGHNAGIISDLGHKGRSYQVLTKLRDDLYVDPDRWLEIAPRKQGSWWPEWTDWLFARSGAPVSPPKMGASLAPAPGGYVLMP